MVVAAEIEALIRRYYGERTTEAHLLMARVPEGARLVATPSVPWPTVVMRNVWVLPGVPEVFRMKLPHVRGELGGGAPFFSRAVFTRLDEGDLKPLLDRVVAAHGDVEIGSYPKWHDAEYRTKLTFDGLDEARVRAARDAFVAGAARGGPRPRLSSRRRRHPRSWRRHRRHRAIRGARGRPRSAWPAPCSGAPHAPRRSTCPGPPSARASAPSTRASPRSATPTCSPSCSAPASPGRPVGLVAAGLLERVGGLDGARRASAPPRSPSTRAWAQPRPLRIAAALELGRRCLRRAAHSLGPLDHSAAVAARLGPALATARARGDVARRPRRQEPRARSTRKVAQGGLHRPR